MANKFYFDGIETSCTRIARNMCGPDEYAVTINDNGTEYEVLLLAGPFGTDEQICADGYAQWRKEHPTNPNNTPSTMNAKETRYNYLEAVTADVLDYIKENNITVTADNREEIEEQLRDDLWACDSVTGNGSGSYTFNSWTAETYIYHNLDLLTEAVEEFGSSMDVLKDGAEACDVTIRCYLLPQAIAAALDEVETEEDTEE